MSYPGRTNAVEMAKLCRLTTGLDTTLAIDMANDIVSEVCATVFREDGITPWHDEHRLTLIETLVALHFYCLNDPRSKRDRVGPLTTETQSKVDLGFDVTHYGQMAKRMDTSGALAALDEAVEEGRIPGKFVCTMRWLGKPYGQWANWPATVSFREGE